MIQEWHISSEDTQFNVIKYIVKPQQQILVVLVWVIELNKTNTQCAQALPKCTGKNIVHQSSCFRAKKLCMPRSQLLERQGLKFDLPFKFRDNHPIPDHPTFFDNFEPNEKNSSFYLNPKIFSHIIIQGLKFILTIKPKISDILCLTEIDGPPKQTTFPKSPNTGPWLDHYQTTSNLRPVQKHMLKVTNIFYFYLKIKHFCSKNLSCQVVHLLDVETQLGYKNGLFHFFILTKSENSQFFSRYSFMNTSFKKSETLWNYTLYFCWKKIMVLGYTIHLHQFLRSTGGECFWGSKIALFSNKWTTLKSAYFQQIWIKVYLASTR